MRNIIISMLTLFGTTFSTVAQDILVLRKGGTVEVNIQRSLEDKVEYTYPGESTVYERPKSAILEIRYKNGRREILDESLRQSEETPVSRQRTSQTSTRSNNSQTTTRGNSQTNADGIPWQDVKTTFTTEEVSKLKRLQRLSATSTVSYKDAILKLKKKAAEIGGTTVLVMDDPDNANGEIIEVIGIAYRDESLEIAPSKTVTSTERASAPVQNEANTRRRRILQQMEGYNNDSKLDLANKPEPRREVNNTSSNSSSGSNRKEVTYEDDNNTSDAVYLLNGRVIRGTIEEFEPDDFVSIRTENDKVYEYSMDDVRRIQRGATTAKSNNRQSANNRQTSAGNRQNANASRRNLENEDNNEYDNRQSRNQNSRPPRSSQYDDEGNYANGSVSGYKGIFDAGYTLPMGTGEKGRFEIHTSHGYQLNDYLFVGAGLGLHVYSARDMNLQYSKIAGQDNFPHYIGTASPSGKITPDSATTWMHGADSSYMTLPIFLDIRGYYPINNIISPFVMFRLGYSFNLTDGFGGMGLYVNPAVGMKFNITPKLGITFSAGYSTQSYGGIPGKNYDGGYGFRYMKKDGQTYEAKSAGGMTLKLGVEF